MTGPERPIEAEIKCREDLQAATESGEAAEERETREFVADFFRLMGQLPIKGMPYFLVDIESNTEKALLSSRKNTTRKVSVRQTPGYCWILEWGNSDYDADYRTLAITSEREFIELGNVAEDYRDYKNYGSRDFPGKNQQTVTYDNAALARKASGKPLLYRCNTSRYLGPGVLPSIFATAYARYRDEEEL